MTVRVMTVLGPVPVADLGHTQCHEHLFLQMSGSATTSGHDGDLIDPDLIQAEVAAYAKAGGRTLVDLTTPDLGRQPELLRAVSAATGVHIVMGTGYYRQPFYPADLDRRRTVDLAAEIVADIRHGADGTGIRPGVIGEIGSNREWVSAQEERVFRACGRAQAQTGLPLMTHTPPKAGPQQLELLAEADADLRQVAVGHADGWLDGPYLDQLLDTGCFLSFDLIGTGHYPDQLVAETIVDLIRRGHLDRLLVSTDICRRQRLLAWGGHGYGYLLNCFVPLLVRLGLDQDVLDRLLIHNPAIFLAGNPSIS